MASEARCLIWALDEQPGIIVNSMMARRRDIGHCLHVSGALKLVNDLFIFIFIVDYIKCLNANCIG